MRFRFAELPGRQRPVSRPVVPIQLEDLDGAPVLCLVDTGSTGTLAAEWADRAGISLDQPLDRTDLVVGGLTTTARCARAALTLGSVRFEAPVWLCDPWPFAVGVLGQEGFLCSFRVTICAADEWLECEPEPYEARGAPVADYPEEELLSGFGD